MSGRRTVFVKVRFVSLCSTRFGMDLSMGLILVVAQGVQQSPVRDFRDDCPHNWRSAACRRLASRRPPVARGSCSSFSRTDAAYFPSPHHRVRTRDRERVPVGGRPPRWGGCQNAGTLKESAKRRQAQRPAKRGRTERPERQRVCRSANPTRRMRLLRCGKVVGGLGQQVEAFFRRPRRLA